MKKEDRVDTLVNVGLAGAAYDAVSRYGAGVKEYLVAYSGKDWETGVELKRSLKKINTYHVDQKCRDANLKQQAGFAAETVEVARRRSEECLAGEKPKTVRTDDTVRADGRPNVNHELYDITSELDAQGNPVPGASAQMKFEGTTAKDAVGNLMSGSHEKYIDNDCKIIVPKDLYAPMKEELTRKAEEYQKQIEHLKGMPGKEKALANAERQLEKCRKLKRNLVEGKETNAEAMEARIAPKKFTAKEILGTSHRAGLEQAKMGAAIGGGISLVRNTVAVFQGKKTVREAAGDLTGDVAGATALSYTTAFAGSVIKGTAQNASSATIRSLAKTTLPSQIATATWETAKTLKKFFNGEIDGTMCIEELGEKGYGMLSAGLFTAIGQFAIPIPIVGALAGSMLGYALSSASYRILLDSLKEARLSHERRIRIEHECEESIKLIREYRAEMEKIIEERLSSLHDLFTEAFEGVKRSLMIGDVDGYVVSLNKITRGLGNTPAFESRDEFDDFMKSKTDFEL